MVYSVQFKGVDMRPTAQYDTGYGIPFSVDLHTEELLNWIQADGRYARKLQKLGDTVFKKYRSLEYVQEQLIATIQNDLVAGAQRLKDPYEGLVLIALNEVDWYALVAPLTQQYEGPEYFDEEEQMESLERALQQMETEYPPSNDYSTEPQSVWNPPDQGEWDWGPVL